MGRVAFHEGEEAAWEDLEQIYLPAADAGELPIRLYSFVPLPTWCECSSTVWAVAQTFVAAALLADTPLAAALLALPPPLFVV